MSGVVIWQRAEGAIVFWAGLGIFLHGQTELTWWIVIMIFFAPDISVAAYLLGPKVGAFGYNLVHMYAFGAALYVIGLIFGLPMMVALGALWLAHSGFDRMLGYGLKSTEGFNVTHLGKIGQPSRNEGMRSTRGRRMSQADVLSVRGSERPSLQIQNRPACY